MDLELVDMSAENLESCVDLYINTFSREPWYDVYDSREQVVNYFKHFMQYNSFVGFVGMLEGKPVALAVGMKKPWINGIEYYVDEFCVDYDLQGKGIGSMFLKQIEEELPRLDLDAMILNTEEQYPSYRFYTKNGFRELEGLVVLAK